MTIRTAVRKVGRSERLWSASSLVLALALAGSAQAADDAAAKEGQVEEIVVTGQREAQRAAIAVKRDDFVVADVVSGRRPDIDLEGFGVDR